MGPARMSLRRITHNEAQEIHPRWASDSRHIFFSVEVGDVSGPYRDLQPHLYWVDTSSKKIEQWAKDFTGQIASFEPTANGVVLTARLGTEVQMYTADSPADSLHSIIGHKGTYEELSTGSHTQRVAFQYSSLTQPAEVLPGRRAQCAGDRPPHHQLQQTLHRARSPARQALPVEGRRRHHCRRHADLSSRQI